MRLDATTGAVEVRPGLVVTSATTPDEMRAAGSDHDGYANGWTWERLHDGDWWVEVSFDPDAHVSMVVLTQDDGQPGGWDHWSEEREIAHRDQHDAWLATQLGEGWATETFDGASKGSLATFPWGQVGSDFDTRSGGSSIHLRYSRQ